MEADHYVLVAAEGSRMEAAGVVGEEVCERHFVDFNGWVGCDVWRVSLVVDVHLGGLAGADVLPWLGHMAAMRFRSVGAVPCDKVRCEARPGGIRAPLDCRQPG